jgi:hypothetical protein
MVDAVEDIISFPGTLPGRGYSNDGAREPGCSEKGEKMEGLKNCIGFPGKKH